MQEAIDASKNEKRGMVPIFLELSPNNVTIEKALITINREPNSLNGAKQSPDWSEWEKAIQEEMNSLNENGTWELVAKPQGVRLIQTRWVFRIKPATKTEPERYKARLVAKGFLQRPVIDYGNTYAPVASFDSIRIMFWLITYLNLRVL